MRLALAPPCILWNVHIKSIKPESLQGPTTAWKVWGSNPGRGKRYFSSLKRAARLWSPPSFPFYENRSSFPGKRGWGVRLTMHLHLLPRWRMSVSIPLLPLYSFMAWTGKVYRFHIKQNDRVSCRQTCASISASLSHLWIQNSCILNCTHEMQICNIFTEIHITKRYLFASYNRRIDKSLLPFCILLFTLI